MSLRLKVYGLMVILALAGGGAYLYKTKPPGSDRLPKRKAPISRKVRSQTKTPPRWNSLW